MGENNSIGGAEVIEWIDSCISAGWHSSEMQKYAPTRCTTFGFLVFENEECVCLAGSTAKNSDSDVSDVMTIPKLVITCRKKVEVRDVA